MGKVLGKILFVLTILTLIAARNDADDSIILYKQAVLLHLEGVSTDTISILKDPNIELPKRMGKYVVNEINDVKKALERNESLYVIKLMPLQINKGDIEIGLIDYLLKKEKGEIVMTHTGSEVFSYRYDNKIKQYKLVKKSTNAI